MLRVAFRTELYNHTFSVVGGAALFDDLIRPGPGRSRVDFLLGGLPLPWIWCVECLTTLYSYTAERLQLLFCTAIAPEFCAGVSTDSGN